MTSAVLHALHSHVLSLLVEAPMHSTLAAKCQPVMSLRCWLLVIAISNEHGELNGVIKILMLLRFLLLMCSVCLSKVPAAVPGTSAAAAAAENHSHVCTLNSRGPSLTIVT